MSENEQQSSDSKKSPLLLILLILALVFVIAAVVFLKQCSSSPSDGGSVSSSVPSERELIPSQALADLSIGAAPNRGPFGVKDPSGDTYLIKIDADGKQALIDHEENVIYEFDTDEKVYIAGISNGRVLLLFTSSDTQFTDPRQTWEGVSQHYGLSVGATNLGLFNIIHSKEDVEGVLSRMKK